MYSEPQTLTVNAVAKTLPRIPAATPGSGVFREADGARTLTISHQLKPTRNRRVVRLDHKKIDVSPFDASGSTQLAYSLSAYLVIDAPSLGYAAAEVAFEVAALVDWLDTSGNLTKLLGGEA